MRVTDLTEAEKTNSAVFTFGRLNPPHYGHHAMINTLIKEAQKNNGDWYLFVSSKTGDEKNPLTYEQKCWWIKALFPETVGHLIEDATIKNPLQAAQWLWNQGYRSATFVAGEDDMPSYSKMMQGGVDFGKKNPKAVQQGKGFMFNPMDFAISPRLASATNARKNVQDNDPEAFVRSILGPKMNPKLATLVHDQLFPTIRKAMGLTESVDENNVLNKKTPSVKQLAKKYTTDTSEIHRKLAKGIKVEFEHTKNIDVATEIAMDHLGERLDYYDLLDKLEKTPKTESSKLKKKFNWGPYWNLYWGKDSDSEDASLAGDVAEAWSKKYKKSINCNNPKGFSQRAHCAGRRARRAGKKTKSQSVTEVANQPYRYMLAKKTDIGNWYIFQTDDGTRMVVSAAIYPAGDGTYSCEIAFSEHASGNMEITGKGDAFRIFATVGEIVKEFLRTTKFNISVLEFSGKTKEPSRIKLYDTIAKNIGKFLPDYVLVGTKESGKEKIYQFKKTNNKPTPIDTPTVKEDVELDVKKTPNALIVKAIDTWGNVVGSVKFNIGDNNELDPQDLEVDPKHRGQGIAKAMYDRVSKMGYTIIRSSDQTAAGKGFWDKYKGKDTKIWETLKKVKGKWALVSRHNPDKVLQYYHGSGHPSKEWVSKVERRVHSFEAEEQDVKPRVYLDMDGVLADFFGEWSRISGVDHYKDIDNVEDKLQLIREHPTFWVDLPVLPNAKALIQTVIKNFGEYRICSKPLDGDPRSKPGKLEWIRTHLSDMPPAEIIITADKAQYALTDGSPNILVDDYGFNVDAWRRAGGIAIKYEDNKFNQVARILEKFK